MIGGDSSTARRIAGGGTGAPENALSDAQNGLASSLGCSTRPARSFAGEPETEIAWKVAFRRCRLTGGKPNGEYRMSFNLAWPSKYDRPMNVRASVILPTFNGEKYLEATIRSILSQTYREFETVIFDDGSSDATLEVIKKLTSERPSLFKIRSHRENRGIGEMIPSMLEVCEGEYIFQLGQDDVWAEDYLTTMVAALDRNPGASAVFAEITGIDSSGRILEGEIFKHRQLEELTMHQVFSKLLAGNFLCAPGSAFRRSLASNAMFGVNNERLQDFELWLNLIQESKFIYVSGARCSYREHRSNLSSISRGRSQLAYEAYACLARILLSERCDDFSSQLSSVRRDEWIVECVRNLLIISHVAPLVTPLTSLWLERLQQKSIGSRNVLRALRSEIALGMNLFRKCHQLRDEGETHKRYTDYARPFLRKVGDFDPEYFNYLLSLGVFQDGSDTCEDTSGRIVYIGKGDAIEKTLPNEMLSAALERGDVIVVAEDCEVKQWGNCLRLSAKSQTLSERDTHIIMGHLEDVVQIAFPPYMDPEVERRILLRFFWNKFKIFIPKFARKNIKGFLSKRANV
jgi:GT2 family glycosyltransferase